MGKTETTVERCFEKRFSKSFKGFDNCSKKSLLLHIRAHKFRLTSRTRKKTRKSKKKTEVTGVYHKGKKTLFDFRF